MPRPQYKTIDFPAGIYRDDTQYRAEGHWWDCDKVRFRNGRPEMIGGWKRVSSTALTGVPRDIHTQDSRPVATSSISQLVFVGTSKSVYKGVMTGASDPVTISFTELTPETFSFTLVSNPFTSVGGSVSYLYCQMSNRVRLLDAVTISGASTFSGISTGELNRLYIVTELNVTGYPAGTVKLESYSQAYVSSGTGGGSSVTATVGMATGTYSDEKQWSFASRGGDCVMCLRDNAIFYMKTDFTTGGSGIFFLAESTTAYPASIPSDSLTANNIPRISRGVTIGKDGSLIALGCSDQTTGVQDLMLVRWSDQENYADWEDREDNTAGSFRLQWGSKILSWITTKRETLIWTDTSLVSMRWTGAPYYYTFEKIADNVGCLAHNTAVAIGDAVYWMGAGQFYLYDGSVKPLPCTVHNYVFSNLNTDLHPVRGGLNPSYNEIWWMYPANEDASMENDHYVIYNYSENVWSIGTLARSAWHAHGIVESTDTPSSLILSSDGTYILAQEYGYSDNNGSTEANIQAYIESGGTDIGQGEDVQYVSELVPNHGTLGSGGHVNYMLMYRSWPNQELQIGPAPTFTPNDDRSAIRLRAREVAVKISSNSNDFKWTMGTPKILIQPDGRR